MLWIVPHSGQACCQGARVVSTGRPKRSWRTSSLRSASSAAFAAFIRAASSSVMRSLGKDGRKVPSHAQHTRRQSHSSARCARGRSRPFPQDTPPVLGCNPRTSSRGHRRVTYLMVLQLASGLYQLAGCKGIKMLLHTRTLDARARVSLSRESAWILSGPSI